MLRAVACAALLVILFGLPASAGPVTLVSRVDPVRPSGTAGGQSTVAGISGDGRYMLFLNAADNLLPGVTDSNAGNDVFFHDRLAGTTVLVSHAAGDPSTAGNAAAVNAVLSADGRWAAFSSDATNLMAGLPQPSLEGNVFLWDRDSGLTRLVSHAAGLPTTATDGYLLFDGPVISADGNRVAFLSIASNLVAGQSDGGSSPDVFLYDRATDTNTLVSHTSGSATTAAGDAAHVALSADGSWVAFASDTTGLVAGQSDTNAGSDVFLYDRATGMNVLVSHAPGALTTTANGSSASSSSQISVSADGGWIAYESNATNMVAGQVDANAGGDILLYDRVAGTNALVSHALSSPTMAGNQYSYHSVVSADGRYVAFVSHASNLVTGDANAWWDVFVYDRIAGTNTLVSRQSAATPANRYSYAPRISSDGAWIGFLSTASNLVAGQADSVTSADAFLWSRASGDVTLVSRTPGSATTAAGGDTTDLRISADGSWIALLSGSDGLVNGSDDFNAMSDVFLYEQATGVNSLLTARGGAASASGGGFAAVYTATVISNDGRSIAFSSSAPNLPGVTADDNDQSDVFLFDRVAGTTRLVSHAIGSPSTTGAAASHDPLLSADGSVVVFLSNASNLISGSGSGFGGQLYLYEPSTGGITLISHAPGAPTTPTTGWSSDSGHYTVSGDGRWIAFASFGTLVAGQVDGNGVFDSDIFLFDRVTGANTLVSHADSSATQTGNGSSSAPSISADGRFIAFVSSASNLVPGQPGAGRIFLFDRIAGTITRVSSSGDSPLAISNDGRWVAFNSKAANVVPGQVDTNTIFDVFLWDRSAGTTLLVSHTPASPTTAGNAMSSFNSFPFFPKPTAPVLSADGRWVVFYSESTDLVSGQTGDSAGVYLFDRSTGTVSIVSRAAGSSNTVRSADDPVISADGRFVLFGSWEGDIVPGQNNQSAGSNDFLWDRIAGTTALVSHIPSSEVTTSTHVANSLPGRISADGAWTVFVSSSPDLAAGDHDGAADVFLHDNGLSGRDFFTVSPCRLLDTRQAGQGPALTSGVKRIVPAQGTCGIPATARVIAVNVTATQPSAAGHLVLYAGDIVPDSTSALNFGSGQTRSNSAIVQLAADGTLAVTPFVSGSGTVDLILDVNGYFE